MKWFRSNFLETLALRTDRYDLGGKRDPPNGEKRESER
jgi:hypothetical protein